MKFKTVLLWQTWGDIRQCIQLFLSRVSLLLAMCCFFCLCTSSTVVWNPNPILINSPRHDTIRVASSRLSRKKKKKEKMLRGWYRSAIISLQRTTAPPPPQYQIAYDAKHATTSSDLVRQAWRLRRIATTTACHLGANADADDPTGIRLKATSRYNNEICHKNKSQAAADQGCKAIQNGHGSWMINLKLGVFGGKCLSLLESNAPLNKFKQFSFFPISGVKVAALSGRIVDRVGMLRINRTSVHWYLRPKRLKVGQ